MKVYVQQKEQMYPTDIVAIILSFVMGVLLSAMSISLLFLLAFLLIYECIYIQVINTQVFVRAGVIIAYMSGWIAGRLAQGLDIALISPEEDVYRFPTTHMCTDYAAVESGCYCKYGMNMGN